MSAAKRRSSKDEMPKPGVRRMLVDNDSQQPKPGQPNGSTNTSTDTDVTVVAPARPSAPTSEAVESVAVVASEEIHPVDVASPDEQKTLVSDPPGSPEGVSAPPVMPAQIVQPPAPANFPPPLPVSPNGASPNDLTYRDLAVPRPPQGWQAPPGEQHRQPAPRPPRGQPAPPPTHVPMLVASSWGATTLNIQANTAAGASYLLWWLSGLLVYFNERHNRFVRFHAMQSILLTGALSIYSVFAYLVSQLFYDLADATNQHAFHTVGTTIAALSFLIVIGVWLGAMIGAWSGTYFKVPVVGRYAERYAAPPAQPPQF